MKTPVDIFRLLQATPSLHSHQTPFYDELAERCQHTIAASAFTQSTASSVPFGDFGDLTLPYYSMGNIDSLKLFGLDELIIFSFYLANKAKYKKTADMGANIGLHTVLMARMGWQVTAFEPDPVHVAKINQHLQLNNCQDVIVKENAISNVNQQLVFTRLAGNRTGSHLKGYKDNVYGDVDEFTVECLALSPLMREFDFIKMDIEGAEALAICSTVAQDWLQTDVMLEVGSAENAEKIWQHLQRCEVSAYSQKTGWAKVSSIVDMPTSYKEGSLFISKNKPFTLSAN